MEFRPLEPADRPAIHATFRGAFADYTVPADFDAPTLERLMARRGAGLDESVGAFEAGRMVAVMVVARREFEGVTTAYDVFTGVLPSHRGRHLAGRMFDFARSRLGRTGTRRFLLEVISSNRSAVRAYERAGFSTRREFRCFELDASLLASVAHPAGIRVERVGRPDWGRWRRWRDWPASWQNHEDSIADSIEPVVCLQARSASGPVGFAVVVPGARDLPQLAVDPERRRRGIGSALLAEAARLVDDPAPLRVINVPATATADLALYARFGQGSLPAQREMVLDFGD